MTKLVAPFLLSGVNLRTVPLDDTVMLDAAKRGALPKLEELTSLDDEDLHVPTEAVEG